MSQQEYFSPPPSPSRPPMRTRRKVLVVVGICVGLVVVVTAVVGSALLVLGKGPMAHPVAGPKTFRLTGTVTVEAGEGSEGSLGGTCFTEGGYNDIRPGAQVTVKDESGKVIALGSLEAGHTSDVTNGSHLDDSGYIVEEPQAAKCVFWFSAAEIPEGRSFYVVEISHRGELRYARADLESELTLSLGG